MLDVRHINIFYGAIHAVQDVSFRVDEGEIVTLIGGNGAGKSTILKAVSGLLSPASGEILYLDLDITSLPAYQIVRKGISHVPEGRRVFANMSVHENLEMGAFHRHNPFEISRDIHKIYDRFPRLRERQSQPAGTLSGGEQQMLATARGLMARPKLLLMDEPSMGLSPLLVKEIFEIIKEINKSGTTILLVEQNAHMALSVAHRAYVLETGAIVLSGPAKDLANNPLVQKVYLGG